jgi:Xaa-Pro aminopeptidase
MDQPSIPLDEFATRRKRLADEAGERGMAGVLVWGQGGASFDFFGETMYLTNHHPMIPHAPLDPALTGGGYAAVLIPVSGEAVLITTSLNDPDERMGIDDVRQDNRLPQAIGAAIEEKGLANEVIGLVGRETLLAYLDAELRAAAPNVTFEPCDEILNYHRMIKSAAELDMMRYAAEKGNDWMNATIAAMIPGVTEADVVATGLDRFIRDGGVQYDVAIAAGAKSDHYWGSSTIPHWNTTRPLEVGDMVHCDLWGLVDSYMTDFARSTVVGNDPSPDQLRVLEDAIGIIEAIVAEIRPGRPISDLYSKTTATSRNPEPTPQGQTSWGCTRASVTPLDSGLRVRR